MDESPPASAGEHGFNLWNIMAESEEELIRLLMKVKEESEKVG